MGDLLAPWREALELYSEGQRCTVDGKPLFGIDMFFASETAAVNTLQWDEKSRHTFRICTCLDLSDSQVPQTF